MRNYWVVLLTLALMLGSLGQRVWLHDAGGVLDMVFIIFLYCLWMMEAHKNAPVPPKTPVRNV